MQSRPVPSPLSVPPRRPAGDADDRPTRTIECLPCAGPTPHVLGRATRGADGQLLVQWWKCTACAEGEAI